MDQSTLVESVVREVLQRLGNTGAGKTSGGANGIFKTADDAVAAASQAQKQLVKADLAVRDGICKLIKKIAVQNADAWGRMELDETKVGRLDHKIAKLHLLTKVPGVEFIRTAAHSGDNGISLDEMAPWGVIGVVTPVTHSVPTLSANAINMIAAGNALVANAHPSGHRSAAEAVRVYNRQIMETYGIDNLICVVEPPTLESANAIFEHPDVALHAQRRGAWSIYRKQRCIHYPAHARNIGQVIGMNNGRMAKAMFMFHGQFKSMVEIACPYQRHKGHHLLFGDKWIVLIRFAEQQFHIVRTVCSGGLRKHRTTFPNKFLVDCVMVVFPGEGFFGQLVNLFSVESNRSRPAHCLDHLVKYAPPI